MGPDDLRSTPTSLKLLSVSEMGARTLLCCGYRSLQELPAMATCAACEGHANVVPAKPETRNKQKGSELFLSLLVKHEGLENKMTQGCLSQTAWKTSKKRMFRLILILFTLNSPVV